MGVEGVGGVGSFTSFFLFLYTLSFLTAFFLSFLFSVKKQFSSIQLESLVNAQFRPQRT